MFINFDDSVCRVKFWNSRELAIVFRKVGEISRKMFKLENLGDVWKKIKKLLLKIFKEIKKEFLKIGNNFLSNFF